MTIQESAPSVVQPRESKGIGTGDDLFEAWAEILGFLTPWSESTKRAEEELGR